MVEVDGQQSDQSQGSQKADARILGQILAAQNVVFALPDTIHIAEFYAQTLLSIPGTIGSRVCLGKKSIQAGEMRNSVCDACKALRGTDEKEHVLAPVDSDFQCNLVGQSDIRIIAIDSYQHHFGFFVSRINNPAAFDVYHPFIHNLSNYVAVILENRLQKDWLQKARDELERKVEARTHDLIVANEELDAARLTALAIMQESIEARQSAEQTNVDLQREVAERKRAEQALRESEELLRVTLTNILDPVFITDNDGKFTFICANVFSALGYSREEMQAMGNISRLLGNGLFDPEELEMRGEIADLERLIVDNFGRPRIFIVTVKRVSIREGTRLYNLHDITKRKQTEEALQASGTKYRIVADNTYDWEFWVNSQGQFLYSSPSCERITGYTPADFEADPTLLDRIIHPEDRSQYERHQLEAFREQLEPEQEFRIVRPDGTQRWLGHVCRPVYDETGRFLGVRGSNRDITERKQTEEALRASERKLGEAAQIAHVGYWERDYLAETINLSNEACQIFGLPLEKSFPRLAEWHEQWQKLIHPEDQPKVMQVLTDALADGPPYNVDYRVVRSDGEVRYIHSYAELTRDEMGKPLRMFGTMIDITERKQAEEALRESEARFRAVFESSVDAIGVSKAGLHIFVNPAYLALFGYTDSADLIGKPILDLIAPSHREQVLENVRRRASGETVPVVYETRGLRQDGSEFDMDVHVSTYELHGETYTVPVLRDITERKRVEDALVFVAQRGWQISGENFFDALAQFLGEKLDMDYVLIDRIDDDPDMAETVALYAKGAITPNMRYALKGTPCENVMGRQLCTYPHGIQQLFPEDTLLREMGAESYIGIPLWDSTGQPIGLIAAMSNKPLVNASPATQLLQLVATRAAAELERERSNRLLRAREHEFRTLAENLPDNIIRYDREGQIVYVNPVIEETLGADAERMIGRRIREMYPNGSYEVGAQAVDAALASGENGEVEFTIPVPGKEKVVHQIRTIVERDEHGEVTGALAIGRDITERKRVEEALRESEEKYRLLHENAGVGIGYYKPNGEVISYNQLAASHMQGKPEDYRGKSIYEIFSREEADFYMERIKLSIATESTVEYEDHVKLPLGEKWFLSVYTRICDAQQNVIGVQIISQDITERKLAEAEIHKLNQELEQRVIDRTARLEAANKELEAFAYSVSHDLRAPLRHIDGFIEMLQNRTKTGLDDQSRHYMDVIAESAKKMGILIDDLLSFSRMGRNEMVKSQVDLNELIRDVIREARQETEGRDIRWKIGSLPLITGDRAMLRMVLVNMISNALKFTRPRAVAEIEIGYEGKEPEVVIFIRDNGVGFNMNYVDKLFGVFQRLHRADEFEGTGIGLANVRRIIERHGGTTWAEGQIDHGATFYFSLPQSKMEA